MLEKNIAKKLKDKDFLKKIIDVKTKDEVIKVFEEENIKITDQDINTFGKIIVNTVFKVSEMSEDELKKISGGEGDGVLMSLIGAGPVYISECAEEYVSEDVARDLVLFPLFAAEIIGLWEGGKWIIKKGKENAWWAKLKNTFNTK